MCIWQIVVISIYLLGVVLVPVSMGAFFPKHASKLDLVDACCGLAFLAICWPVILFGLLAVVLTYAFCLIPASIVKQLVSFGCYLGDKWFSSNNKEGDEENEDNGCDNAQRG